MLSAAVEDVSSSKIGGGVDSTNKFSRIGGISAGVYGGAGVSVVLCREGVAFRAASAEAAAAFAARLVPGGGGGGRMNGLRVPSAVAPTELVAGSGLLFL